MIHYILVSVPARTEEFRGHAEEKIGVQLEMISGSRTKLDTGISLFRRERKVVERGDDCIGREVLPCYQQKINCTPS